MVLNIYIIVNKNKNIEFEVVSLLLIMINIVFFYMCVLYCFYKCLNR